MNCPTELAWAAGFFDGEGTISQTTAKGTRKRYLIVRIGHVDPRPLRQFAEIVGLGNVNGPYSHTKGEGRWSDFYTWQVSGTKARAVLTALCPYLADAKREQYARVSAYLEEHNELAKHPA